MELHRPRVLERKVEPFDGSVVERDVGRFPRCRRRDREAVVLARDEDASRRPFENWMVRAAVPERKLEGLVPGGEGEQLVAETDPEQRHAADQLAHDGDLVLEGLGVAGTIREEDSVETKQLARGRVVRKHRHRRARTRHATEDGALAAVIDDGDPYEP